MAEIHHFAYGWITPTLAYALSVLGSLLGLICAARVRDIPSGGRRARWLVQAAFAIGGTGIWVMHFMAMLGFSVVGSPIRYNVLVTALSAVVAVVVVGAGLFIVAMGRPAAWKVLVGGVFAGLGVNAMHYMGMAAMQLDGTVRYDPVRVGASVAIAVVAATVALWLCVTVHTGPAIFGSALVMGIAVCGMHYTGMSAMTVHAQGALELGGATAPNLIGPIVLAVIFVILGLVYNLVATPTEEDRAGAAYLDARMNARLAEPPPGPTAPGGRPSWALSNISRQQSP